MQTGQEELARFWSGSPLYAYVETAESTTSEQGTSLSRLLVLDLVRATDMQRLFHSRPDARDGLSWVPSAIAVAKLPSEHSVPSSRFSEGSWEKVVLGEGDVQAYLLKDLDADPHIPVAMRVLPEPSPDERRSLKATVNLDDVQRASPAELQALELRTPGIVDVIHVGQGNCNAVCDSRGVPRVYYDLGAGCLWNAHTCPKGLQLCFTEEPPVVLSHWDFDHWYAAEKDPRALALKWFAPNQSVGVRTRKFVDKLVAAGSLRIWPPGTSYLVAGALRVLRCRGITKNDSGLALGVRFADGQVVLCPGDAGYDSIPLRRMVRRPLAGLIASHHGSSHLCGTIPAGVPNAPIAFAYGTGNTYHHPSGSLAHYHAAGWSRQLMTPNGNIALGGPHRGVGCGGRQCTITTTQS